MEIMDVPHSLSHPHSPYPATAELGSFACRILVVADSREVAVQLAEELGLYGHQTFVGSAEPRQLLKEVDTCIPAIVIIKTAAGVPGVLASCGLTSCIRAVGFIRQPLIFVCSTVADGICRHEAQMSGVDYFLSNPATCEQIAALARHAILGPRAHARKLASLAAG